MVLATIGCDSAKSADFRHSIPAEGHAIPEADTPLATSCAAYLRQFALLTSRATLRAYINNRYDVTNGRPRTKMAEPIVPAEYGAVTFSTPRVPHTWAAVDVPATRREVTPWQGSFTE